MSEQTDEVTEPVVEADAAPGADHLVSADGHWTQRISNSGTVRIFHDGVLDREFIARSPAPGE